MKSTQVGHNMTPKNKKENKFHIVTEKDFEELISFDSLNVGDSFRLPRVKGSPQGECPLHVKAHQAHDEDMAIVNYHIVDDDGDIVHRDWLPSSMLVILVSRRITKK